METLESLPNIGPKLATALRDVGIDTPDALREAGTERASLLLMNAGHYDCSQAVAAIEGAIQGVPKADLDDATRQKLQRFQQKMA